MIGVVEPSTARVIWSGLEHLHAVTYFAPECRETARTLGLRGFWAGYFACRAAPMGAVTAGPVVAAFYNFHPAMVRRAIPEVWDTAAPADVVVARRAAAASALSRLLPDATTVAAELLAMLTPAIDAADGAGRALFAANRALTDPPERVSALWQATTTLREHRGDGHVAVLTAEGLDGCEAHVLFAASEAVPPELLRDNRGWSDDDWEAARARLAARGLLTPEGAVTPEGRGLRGAIERRTDALAFRPYQVLGADGVDHLVRVVTGAARIMSAAGSIPYPNPIGLSAPD